MISFLAGIGAKAWAYVGAALAVVAGIFIALGKAKQAGRLEVASKVNEASADTTKRMLDAAVQAPKEKAGVVEDLRLGKF